MTAKKVFQTAGKLFGILMGLGFLLLTSFLIWNRSLLQLGWYALPAEETTYLIFFQNALELRPTGGFLGNFVEITIEDRKIKEYSIVNTNQFDENSPNEGLPVPTGFQDLLPSVSLLQLRDANWNPDFPTSAKQMMQLYAQQGGEKDIRGVITIDSHILPVLLEELGPVYLESLGGEPVSSDDVLWRVQYDTNWGFFERGVDRANRKEALVELVSVLEERLQSLNGRQAWRLGQRMIDLAERNHIMAFITDEKVQDILVQKGWDGSINQGASHFFQLVDANLGGLKTDYFMKRDVNMSLEQCEQGLCVEARILYTNTAEEESILNSSYRSYTRILLPQEAFVTEVQGASNGGKVDYTIEHNRKVAGFSIEVPVNQSREIIIRYYQSYNPDDLTLFFAKQPGVFDLNLQLITPSGTINQVVERDELFEI